MPVRRGHVAPQTTFVDSIIRKFEGLSEYHYLLHNLYSCQKALFILNFTFLYTLLQPLGILLFPPHILSISEQSILFKYQRLMCFLHPGALYVRYTQMDSFYYSILLYKEKTETYTIVQVHYLRIVDAVFWTLE